MTDTLEMAIKAVAGILFKEIGHCFASRKSAPKLCEAVTPIAIAEYESAIWANPGDVPDAATVLCVTKGGKVPIMATKRMEDDPTTDGYCYFFWATDANGNEDDSEPLIDGDGFSSVVKCREITMPETSMSQIDQPAA